jgi:ribosomal protein S18 acetylase RimI-like enzyme
MKEEIETLTLNHFKYFPEILGITTENFLGLNLINSKINSSMFNIVFGGLAPPITNGEENLKDIINIFKNYPFAWWIPPSKQSKELSILLDRSGLIVEAKEDIMLCELKFFQDCAQTTDLEILQVLTREQLDDFISILEVYDPMAITIYNKLRVAQLQNQEKLFIGYKNNIPAVISILFSEKKIAGIFSLITTEKERGKGLGNDMMKFLMNFAKNNGALYTSLSASSDSGYRIYQRLGFKTIGNFECFEYKP